LLQSIIAKTALYEFKVGYAKGMTVAVYVGMLTGAIFWGLRYAFIVLPRS
jgi:hypothetical protein